MRYRPGTTEGRALGLYLALTVSITAIFIPILIPSVTGEIQASTNIKVNSGSEANRFRVDLAVDSNGVVYAMWEDFRNGDWDLYLSKSLDFGGSWVSPDYKVNHGLGNQTYPSIAVDIKGIIHAVWQDDRNGNKDIYYSNSSDGGLNWLSPEIRISTDTPGMGNPNRTQQTPEIALDSEDNIYVIWQDDRWGDDDIFFAKSLDGGSSWTNPNKRVNTDSGGIDQRSPALAVTPSGSIYVSWEENRLTDYDIFFSKSLNGGSEWSDPYFNVISDATSQNQANPTMGIDSEGNIYIAWEDRRNGNDYDIYLASSSDSGETWLNPNVRVDSATSGIQSNPALAIGGSGTIYIAWQDSRNSHRDIYCAYSIDKGLNWSKPDIKVIDETAGMTQLYPAIEVAPTGRVHLAWQDNRNYTNEIYSAYLGSVHPYPFVDFLKVDGFFENTPEIGHILSSNPDFSFTYFDPTSALMSRYNVSVIEKETMTLIWFCNTTDSKPSGTELGVTYNTAPCPQNGPPLIDGKSYILRVSVANITGTWSPGFEISFHLNEVLLPPSSVLPADSVQIPAQQFQTVSWFSPGPDSEGDYPVRYTWEVATDSQFLSIIESGSFNVLESDPFDTRPSGIFYWRVRLFDGWETGEWGNQPDSYWDFSTYTSSQQNSPPTITNKADIPKKIAVNSTLTFSLLAHDPDGDTLLWLKTSGPSWLNLGSYNGTLFGSPSPGNLGNNIFSVQVSDGKGGIDNHTFTITVSPEDVGNQDGDDDGGEPDFVSFIWILIFIIIVMILILIFFIIYRRSREEEEEEPKKENEAKKESDNAAETLSKDEDSEGEIGEDSQGKEDL